jgi:hypothetical protein
MIKDSLPHQDKENLMTRSLKLLPLAILIVMLVLPAWVTAQTQGWLSYYPSVSRLQGKLIKVMKYGAPTYGVEPDKDEKVEVPILMLQTPVRVRPSPQSSSNAESMTNISFVQLIFSDEMDATLGRYLDQQIVVAGTLAIGKRGDHFTDVVMTVKAVNPTGKPL